ncbi:putative Histidine kinase [Candidatus Terasakiella magnetica]|uniref:histidine kinase n=1 Tax=Candidatus Terasakiella magnetica TaxID=1867952 RepID=A0A1C3RL72_9PROT|nr:ATP-binding protein [Candidatus Terasakiella magnetica]SCA58036.1 putative Histidine kinase [Candidatus Terasakiella magnetica]
MSPSDQSDKIAALEEEVRQLKAEVEKAKLSEKRFLDALRLSPMALCHHDTKLRYTWLYNGHMGFVQDEVIGKTDWDILGQDLADRMGVIKRRVLETGIGERVEMPTVSGDEDSEYFDLVVEPMKEAESGEVIGLACSGIDVTDDRRRREAYKASEENLRFIFNASPIPIVVTHLVDGNPLFYNKAADNAFKLQDRKNIFEWLGIEQEVNATFARGEAVNEHKFAFVSDADEQQYFTISCTKIFYDGEAAVLSTYHDLTQEARYQQHLEEAKEKAELASVAKSQFLASASHDLRQPLHAMGLLLSVLEQYIVDPAGVKVLDRITNSLETMNELFAGILDISKLDANVVPVNLEAVSVRHCFDMLEQEFVPVAEEKGLQLTFVKTSCHVQTDAVQFERLLRNFIGNAIRYTPKDGRILVGTKRHQGQLTFYVHDTGIGISPQDQKVIFQEFRQVGNPERDRRKGLGLGLAICDRISDLLGTKIGLSSQEEKGSSFWFSLPTVEVETRKEEAAVQGDGSILEGCRVLFVEDEVDVQIATEYMFEAWGCVPLVAGSVSEALAHCDAGKERPDVIVADYRLRENETGLDAIMEVRKKLALNIPAVVLSGDTAPDLIRTMERHGLVLLNKPLMPKELRECMSEMLS